MKANHLATGEIDVLEEPQLDFKYYVNPIQKRNEVKPKKNETLNVLSLFSGCGGMDLGFEGGFSVLKSSVNEILTPNFIDKKSSNGFVQLKKTKFKTVFANDILNDARNAWVNYFLKKGRDAELFHTQSIVDLVKLHQSGIDVFPKNIDVVTGGFPCQDFSIAGKRNGFNSHKNHNGKIIDEVTPTEETRGQLYMWMKQVIEITKPKIFIAENVKGLVNLENVKEIIQKDFSSAGENGYIVLNPRVLHSANYGVPQSRERVIFIGIKKSELTKSALAELEKETISDKYNPYPKPTHSYTAKGENLKKFVELNELFSLLEEPENAHDLSQKFYSKAKYMGAHCQGQTEIKLNGISPTIRAEHHGNIEFHYDNTRRLSAREAARIQSFPDNFVFLSSTTDAYKQVGNAVAPVFGFPVQPAPEHAPLHALPFASDQDFVGFHN